MNGLAIAVAACFGMLQVLGLASAAIARLSEGSDYQAASQRLFIGCLVVLGVTTLGGLLLGVGYWLASGTTFSIMMLVATCDFSHAQRTATS